MANFAEQWDASDTVPSSELRQIIDAAAERCGGRWAEPVDNALLPDGVGARYWRFPGAAGAVGFRAISRPFLQ